MENLLCNEVMSPIPENDYEFNAFWKMHSCNSFSLPIEDCEEAFAIFLGNESSFMPESGYLKLLQTNTLIRTARFKAVNFFIKFQRRMDLSVEIVFMAVNYLDRFISLDQCRGWKYGMFELLSVACLSVALKFSGTASNFLNEFQMNSDVENWFDATKIQEMELTLMSALGWRMNTTTPFSYIHLMIQKIIHSEEVVVEVEGLSERVTQLLVNALLDPKLVEFKQCVIAACAIRCVVEEEEDLKHAIIPQLHKDDVIKCRVMMVEQLSAGGWGGGPPSPVTVLKEEFEIKSSRKRRKMQEREGF